MKLQKAPFAQHNTPATLQQHPGRCCDDLPVEPNAAQPAATVGEKQLFLTVDDVARLLRVPVSWVYGRLRRRSIEQIPAYKVGKYWRFREREVMVWVESQRKHSHAA